MAKKKTQTLEEALVPESEQPYAVPENWVWVKCLTMFDVVYGKGLPTKELQESGYPVFGANGQIGYYSSYMYEEEKVLMSCRGAYSGTINVSLPFSFITNNSLILDCRNENISYKFIEYLFRSQNICNLISGSAQPQITVQAFNDFAIPLPPLAEQRRIVAHIESLFEKLDHARELVQSALDSFETRKAAILHKAFTGELTAQWRTEHGVGMDSWEEKKIEDVGVVKGGKRLPKGEKLVDFDTGLPYIKAGDLKQGTVIAEQMQYLTPEVQKKIKQYTVTTNDVYVTIVGACIGDVGVIPEAFTGANLTENAAKITMLKCNSTYLARFLASHNGQQQIKSKIASATLGKLSLQSIKSIMTPLPSLPEQQEIVRILDSLLEKEQKAKEQLEPVLDHIDLMKKSILARAFRGELGTNDPSEESALGLLEEITNGGS